MGLTKAEQETTVRWDEDSKLVSIWSGSPVTWRKMARLGIRPTRETTTQGAPTGKSYTLPLDLFRWGVKRRRGSTGNPEALRRFRQSKRLADSGQDAAGGLA